MRWSVKTIINNFRLQFTPPSDEQQRKRRPVFLRQFLPRVLFQPLVLPTHHGRLSNVFANCGQPQQTAQSHRGAAANLAIGRFLSAPGSCVICQPQGGRGCGATCVGQGVQALWKNEWDASLSYQRVKVDERKTGSKYGDNADIFFYFPGKNLPVASAVPRSPPPQPQLAQFPPEILSAPPRPNPLHREARSPPTAPQPAGVPRGVNPLLQGTSPRRPRLGKESESDPHLLKWKMTKRKKRRRRKMKN